jgi:hypothetical protein
MKTLWCAAGVLALSTAAYAQPFTLHGSPQGVTSCSVPAAFTEHTLGTGLCPMISFQTHWKPGGGSPSVQPPNTLTPNLAHTHIECNLPHEAEMTGPVTVPCRFVLFHTAGQIILAQGDLVTNITMDDPTGPWPLVGDPNSVLLFYFHATFDPTVVKSTSPVPPHGWFSFRLMCRTAFGNGDLMDTQIMWSAYSMRDPRQPEALLGEAGINLGSRAVVVSARDSEADVYGIHLVEVRDTAIPLYASFRTPIVLTAASYSYGPDNKLPAGEYKLLVDPDLHRAVTGTSMSFKSSPAAGGSTNIDILDPVQIDASLPPVGFAAHHHRVSLLWSVATDPNNFIHGDHGGLIAPNQEIFALLNFEVAIGDNPQSAPPPAPVAAPSPTPASPSPTPSPSVPPALTPEPGGVPGPAVLPDNGR